MVPETGRRFTVLDEHSGQAWGPLCADCLNSAKYREIFGQLLEYDAVLMYEHGKEGCTYRSYGAMLANNMAIPNVPSTGISLACSGEGCKFPTAPPANIKKVDSLTQTYIGLLGSKEATGSNNMWFPTPQKQKMLTPTGQRYTFVNHKTFSMRGTFCANCMNVPLRDEVEGLSYENQLTIIEYLPVGCYAGPLADFTHDVIDEKPFIENFPMNYSLPCLGNLCCAEKAFFSDGLAETKSVEVQTDFPMPDIMYGFDLDLDELERRKNEIVKERRLRKLERLAKERERKGPSVAPSDLVFMKAQFRKFNL